MSRPDEPGGARGVVAAPIYCRKCGYNLYGLRVDRVCPECGLEIWETILHTVDPAASRLPRLHNPEAVGNALLWLVVCMVVGALLVVARPIALGFDSLDETNLRNTAAWTPAFLPFVAGLLGLAALWSVWRLAPPRREEPRGALRRDVRRLGAGVLLWAALVTLVGWTQVSQMSSARWWLRDAAWLGVAAAAIIGLSGLRGVLETIGLRSRVYRTARGGRQGTQDLVAAILGTAIGHGLHLLTVAKGLPEYWHTLGTVVVSVSTLMLVIGLVYLLVNAWWIRRALRRPPPAWNEVLRPE
jgi:hypothetical protein